MVMMLWWVAAALGADVVVAPADTPDVLGLLGAVSLDPPLAADAEVIPVDALGVDATDIWIGPEAAQTGCAGEPGAQADILGRLDVAVSHRNYGELEDAARVFGEAEAMLACATEPIEAPTLWTLYFESAVLAAIQGDDDRAVRRFGQAVLAHPAGRWNETYNPTIKDLYLRGREASDTVAEVNLQVVVLTPRVGQTWINGSRVAGRASITRQPTLVQADVDGTWRNVLVTATGSSQLWFLPVDDLEKVIVSPRDVRQAKAASAVLRATRGDDRILAVDPVGRRVRVYTDRAAEPLLYDLPAVETEAATGTVGPRLRALGGTSVQPGYDLGVALGAVQLGARVPVTGPMVAGVDAVLGVGPAGDQVVFYPVVRAGAGVSFDAGPVVVESLALLTLGLHEQRGVSPGPALALGAHREVAGSLHLEGELTVGYNVEALVQAVVGVGWVL